MFTWNVSRKCEPLVITPSWLEVAFCNIYSPVMYASPLAANPTKHNEFALGLSDGGVLVIEEEDIGIAL